VGNLQIKDVPTELHQRLKARAGEAGISQRDYVLRLIERDLELPSKAEWLRRLQSDPPSADFDGAALIREVREERDAELEERMRRIEDGRPPEHDTGGD
jgi:hypothetical protein